MIQKKYKTKESLISALDHLIDIHEKSVYNAIANPTAGANIKNIIQKLSEIKKVKEELIEMNEIIDVDENHTYNIVTREKDDKTFHAIILEKVENEEHVIEKEYILNVESR